MNKPLRFLIITLFVSSSVFSQRLNKADRIIVTNLRSHISYLADDKLEGRRTGTEGEKIAREYISNQFRLAGLEPKGDKGDWFQSFEIYDGKQINSPTLLLINGHDLRLNDDYFPLVYSPNKSFEAAVSPALKEPSVP